MMKNKVSQTIDLSIIIVSWNTRQVTCNCLKSIFEQSVKLNYEVIVVDNASSDDSVEAIKNQFSCVKLICNESNLGFSKANNIGIRSSSGKYICLVNSDVIVFKGCFESLADFMENNSSVGLSGPRILNSDGSLQASCRSFPSIWNNFCQVVGLNKVFSKSSFFSEPLMKHWAHDKVRKVDVLSGCFWIARREALDEVGLLDEDFFIYGEDVDWCRRFHIAGWDVMFYPEAEAIHLGGASSDNAPIKFYLEMEKADLQYWKKHHGKVGLSAYTMILLLRHILRLISGSVQYVSFSSRREIMRFKLKRSSACLRQIFHLITAIGGQ